MSQLNQQEKERFVLLLLKGHNLWSDEDITVLLAHSEEIKEIVYILWRSFPEFIEQVRRYRARKKELSKLPTEELLVKQRAISDHRAAAMANDPDDTELPDSFFEAPPFYSDESIIYEILEERKMAA